MNRSHEIDYQIKGESIQIVEPAGSSVPPLEVTVVDRPTGRERRELRQPWKPAEELIGG